MALAAQRQDVAREATGKEPGQRRWIPGGEALPAPRPRKRVLAALLYPQIIMPRAVFWNKFIEDDVEAHRI